MKVMERKGRTAEDAAWAAAVVARDNYTCQWCGLTAGQLAQMGGHVEAHHKIAYRARPGAKREVVAVHEGLRTTLSNGITLCVTPHGNHPLGTGNGGGCHAEVDPYRRPVRGSLPLRRRSLWRSKHRGSLWLSWLGLFVVVGMWLWSGPVPADLNGMVNRFALQAVLALIGVFAVRVVVRGIWRILRRG